MFVAIHTNVPVQSEKVADFKKWFEESNQVISKNEGFISRRLLQSSDGILSIMAEWQNKAHFDKVHGGETHQKLRQQARSFMSKEPDGPKFYDVVVG